jgi:hypothetical protein
MCAHHVTHREATRAFAEKKLLHASEQDRARVQPARTNYRELTAPLDAQCLKFIDEAGVNLAMTYLYGRALTGERVIDAAPQNYRQKVIILGALSMQGIDAVMMEEGATDAEVFWAYIAHVLVPTLRPGDIVVMDNLRAHKAAGVQQAICIPACLVMAVEQVNLTTPV